MILGAITAPMQAAPRVGSKVQLVMTPLLAAKVVLSCVFAGCTLYYLNTGRKYNDFGRLMWAGIFGLLTALVFGL